MNKRVRWNKKERSIRKDYRRRRMGLYSCGERDFRN